MDRLTAATALVIIDVQDAFDDPRWGHRNNPEAEVNIARLLGGWRQAGRPIFHVRHLSRTPGSLFHPDAPGSRIKALVHPLEGEPLIEKWVNSAFIGTDLEDRLRGSGRMRCC